MRDLNLRGCFHPGHVHACHQNEWSVNELPASESSLNEFPLDGFSPIQTRTGCFSFNNEPSLAWRPPKSSSSEFPYSRARTPNQMPPRSMQVPEWSQYPSSASGLVSRDLKPDEDPRDLLSESQVAMLPGQAYKRSRSLTSMSDMPSSVHTNEQSLFRYRNRRDAYVRSTKTSSRVVGADEDKESWENEHELNSLNDSDEAVDHDEGRFALSGGTRLCFEHRRPVNAYSNFSRNISIALLKYTCRRCQHVLHAPISCTHRLADRYHGCVISSGQTHGCCLTDSNGSTSLFSRWFRVFAQSWRIQY